MLYAIFCTDKPDSSAVRTANRPAHLDYIRAVASQVVVAGPTFAPDGETVNGSLLVLDFVDRAAAETFAQHDPYNQAGLFSAVEIRAWKKVFPES
jgi:uncharacterized protein YciI